MSALLPARGCPVVLFLLLVSGAFSTCLAQESSRAITPRIVVSAFTDPADLPDRMIGRRAGDAVASALQAEGPWELTDSAWLLRLCEAEGLSAPLAVGHLQMLGQRMRAPLALAGLVENCRLNVARGVAQVTLLSELVETLAGSSLGSVRGVASATREPDESLEQALDRALSEAAADMVRQLVSFDAGAAVVVTTLPDGRVLLDGPAEPRIKPGAKLLIFRGNPANAEAIGAVEVQTSRITVLHAQPLAGEDFFQGDRGVVVAR